MDATLSPEDSIYGHYVFVKSNNSSTSVNQNLLGLSTAKLIIERGGGQISFEVQSGDGARCVIVLPVFDRSADGRLS